jgi:cell division septation protein DedD
MANDEKEAKEKSVLDEIDKEVGLGDIQKDRDSKYLKYLKNVLFVLLPAVIVLTVFGVSFKIGEKISFVNKTKVKDFLQENVTQNSKELPAVAVVPEADQRVEGEVISGVKESSPVTKVEPASIQVEKVDKPVMEKNMVKPAQNVVAPIAKVEEPAVAVKPEVTAPVVKPAAIASTVKPAVEAPKPVAKQKAADAKKPETLKQYKVIVGSFSIRVNADNLISQLKAKNYEPIVVRTKTSKGQFYRVIVGSYRSFSETKTMMGELTQLGFQPFYIFE